MKKRTVAILSLTLLMTFTIIVLQAEAVSYPLTLASPNALLNGYFGYSVSNDGRYVVVGAAYETSGSYSAAGRAYVFK